QSLSRFNKKSLSIATNKTRKLYKDRFCCTKARRKPRRVTGRKKSFTMRSVGILAVFVLALAFTRADDASKDSIEDNIKDIVQAIGEKFNATFLEDVFAAGDKVKAKCPDIEDKMKNMLTSVGECADKITLGSDTFCSLIVKNFDECTKPMKEVMDACSPDESKDVPEMVLKMVKAVIVEACASTVEEMLELLNPCKMEGDPTKIEECKKVLKQMEDHKSQEVTKSLICQTMPKVRGCMKAVLDKSCSNAITKTIHNKMYQALEKSVKTECDAVNKV
ncbi:unnamed protein product, partial [Phyllotreta striolata]